MKKIENRTVSDEIFFSEPIKKSFPSLLQPLIFFSADLIKCREYCQNISCWQRGIVFILSAFWSEFTIYEIEIEAELY